MVDDDLVKDTHGALGSGSYLNITGNTGWEYRANYT